MPNDQSSDDEKYLLYIEHGNQYTDLLKIYIANVKTSNNLKRIFKKAFFRTIMTTMVVLLMFFGYSVYKSFEIIGNLDILQDNSMESIVGVVGTLIPSFATLLAAIIKLPEIIAKYLFNRKEEEHMARIIENIQKYDVQIYSIEKDAKEFAKKQQSGIISGEIPNKDLPGDLKEPSDDSDSGSNISGNHSV